MTCSTGADRNQNTAGKFPEGDDLKKNILLITSDQHHYSCMGYHNPDLAPTFLDVAGTDIPRCMKDKL